MHTTKQALMEQLEEQLSQPSSKSGLSLSFPCDLRQSIGQKIPLCSPYFRWTAFVNNAGTLCHVISPESGILIRLTFGYPIKHLSAYEMHKKIVKRISHWVIL